MKVRPQNSIPTTATTLRRVGDRSEPQLWKELWTYPHGERRPQIRLIDADDGTGTDNWQHVGAVSDRVLAAIPDKTKPEAA